MRKIYKSDLGTLIYIGLGIPLFFSFSFLALFIFKDAPTWIKIASPIVSLVDIFCFIHLLKYKLILDDESISSQVFFSSLLPKYNTFYNALKFEEVGEIINSTGIFEEATLIFLKPRDKSKKLMSFPVGFGLPWSVLNDILACLPKDVKVTFEPFIWRHINKPDKPDTKKRLIITVIILILLILAGFLYSWWDAFMRNK